MSGTFGEYRTGHFHAGIDLSTGGRIGLPVRAVAAGRVVRLRGSPYGYGRAIYIDIDGGRQVVFAHLSGFAPRWQALVEAEQERLGKYTVDFAVPESTRVAAGEVVAYTGDSGGGGPHLHFEVRKGDTDPINPLTHGWEAEDGAAPVIRALRLVPLGLEGRVDGGLDPVVVRVARSAKDGVYRAPREHTVSGPVGVQVLAADRAGRCEDSRAIFGASLALDNSVLFETEFQLVSYLTDWDEVDVRYDAAARAEGLGNFARLYEPVGWAGALMDTVRGESRLDVGISDAAGNLSRAEVFVRREGPGIAAARAMSFDDFEGREALGPSGEPVATKPPSPEECEELALVFFSESENPGISMIDRRGEGVGRIIWRLTSEGLIARMNRASPGASSGPDVARAWVIPGVTHFSGPRPQWIPVASATAEPCWWTIPKEDLLVDEPMSALERKLGYTLVIFSVNRSERERKAMNVYLSLGPFERGVAGTRTEVVSRWIGDDLESLTPGARLVISENGLFGDALLTGSATPRNPRIPGGLVTRAEPARFDPADLLLREKVEVRFAVPDTLRAAATRLAVYSVEPDGSVECLGGAFDAETGEIVALTRALGTFVLLEDASPPRLSRPRPADGATTTNARPRLLVRVAETGEGLDDEGVRFTIDGERLIPEYDPDAGHIVARPKRPLARGAHRVDVRLSDKAGNEATTAWRFTVTGKRSK